MADNKEDTPPPPFATLALALTIQDWGVLGLGNDPETAPTNDLDVLVERVTALLLVRCVALVAPQGQYPDLSTSNICRHVLMSKKHKWPNKITDKVVKQLQDYVKRILSGYKDDVPYHNREHAVHVVLSTNKLMDLMVSQSSTGKDKKQKPPPSYGLRNDPMALLALLFAALIHDVEHQGIPNRQLAMEDDRLAILYNDQSIAENWSIYIGFSELLQDEYKELRETLFPAKEDYHRFRKIVINLVLNTDIASPERTQLSKSKWKEAFGDPFETIERKMQAHARRMSLAGQDVQVRLNNNNGRMARRGTGDVSEVSFDPTGRSNEEDDDDADDSISVTPEHSENGQEPEYGEDCAIAHVVGMTVSPPKSPKRRSSLSFQRRRSSTASRSTATSKYRQRLGIMRTVDLSGETLINYTRSGSMDNNSTLSSEHPYSVDVEEDEPNELKATVVMETFISAADVAHNLQGWDLMVKFSSRLYLELRKAFIHDRGVDPEPRWFENQIGFLESYLLPLAHRLEDTGVFPEIVSQKFAETVEANRDMWLTAGYDVSQQAIEDGAKAYPKE